MFALSRARHEGEHKVHPYTMPQRKAFLLRIDPAVLESVQRWANDDLRSLNAQIEFILRRALLDRDRLKRRHDHSGDNSAPDLAAPEGESSGNAGIA